MLLSIIRQLQDQQQFVAMQQQAEAYWLETGDFQVLPLLGFAFLQLKQHGQAHALIQQIEAQQALLDDDAVVDLAAVYALTLQLERAVSLLEPILVKQPYHALAQARLGWCRMMQGDFEAALEWYQSAIQQLPKRIPLWHSLVRVQIERGDYVAAQAALQQAIACLSEQQSQLAEAAQQSLTVMLREAQLVIWCKTAAFEQAEEWLNRRQLDLSEEDWVMLVGIYANLLAGQDLHSQAEDNLREGLKHYSDNLALLNQLAEFAQLQGRTLQAVQLLRRCIKQAELQDKPAIDYYLKLSSVCLHQNDEQAAEAADKALSLIEALTVSEAMPELRIKLWQQQAITAQAQVKSQQQLFDEAEALFKQVLDANPYCIPALSGLGQQLMQLGDISQAVVLFERVQQLDPAAGFSSLVNARQFPEDEAALEQLEKLARRPSLEGSVRSRLLFNLAAAWEKRKDYDRAWALVAEANAASKKLLNYDAKAHRNQCARIRYAFSRSLYEHRSDCGHPSSLPVYVVGMPRSGSTLVEQILGGHSQIFGAGELGVIPSRIQGINRWERHAGSGRFYPDCVDDINTKICYGIAENILKELQDYAPEAKHIVDKLPHNFESIGLIKFLFPNAKIISVRRDPRDIAISNYFTDYQAKHGGMGFAYDLEWIGQQLADHNMMMHHWHRVFPGQILEINYEDVVEDLEGSARKMLAYIGVDWEPQVLGFNELERAVKTASVWQVRQPIYKTSKAKWMRYQNHLAPLIKGTNARIDWDEIEMVALPEPSLLQTGVDAFNQRDLDKAELCFKKLLHHLPKHGGANFMLGLVLFDKGRADLAMPHMRQGLEICPWNKKWRKDWQQAFEAAGQVV